MEWPLKYTSESSTSRGAHRKKERASTTGRYPAKTDRRITRPRAFAYAQKHHARVRVISNAYNRA